MAIVSLPMIAHAEWQAIEKTQAYSITGHSGIELYRSIGERGPKIDGRGRTIALTTFKLTWRRKYEPQGDACVLVSAQPKLIITYMLPKPAAPLPASIQGRWETFIAGVQKHERVHGESIKSMVKEIETASVGLSVPNDPDCSRIRTELTRRLGDISSRQRQRDRDFDRVELSKGGNIHQLILGLVNDPSKTPTLCAGIPSPASGQAGTDDQCQ
jgi:predicted secreted Zn-dependent protease